MGAPESKRPHQTAFPPVIRGISGDHISVNAATAPWRVRVTFVPPWRFVPRSWFGYLWPRRITLREEGRAVIYRWLWWNIQTREGR